MTTTLSQDLKNIKVGDKLKMNLHGAGHVTAGEDAVVKKVNQELGIFWTDNSDGGYVESSLYAYSIETGMTINNMISGFFLKVCEVTPKKATTKKPSKTK
jgi:hypothetical protein